MLDSLDFEKKIVELESKIEELRHLSSTQDVNIAAEITRLKKKTQKLMQETYNNLSAWQTVQVARHPARPHSLDYIQSLIKDFVPLAGDRLYGEDAAIVGGMGRFRGQSVMVLGHEKGHETETRVKHGFGMPRPEGYRKAQRLMRLADLYQIPLLTFVDTAGAYPGIEAEARGQAEAIARTTEACLEIKVPFVSIIIGEGGSGGAIAIATANKVLMLSHSVYSVISPEGCASILWRSREKREEAAEALRIKASDLLKLGVIDEIIPEPLGGAHRHPQTTIEMVGNGLETTLKNLLLLSPEDLKQQRRYKYLNLGNIGL